MKLLIDGRSCEAEYGEYILTAAKRNGIDIPALCHMEALSGLGSCRLCIVELVEGEKSKTVASCIYPITRELDIRTDSYRINRIRKTIMKLLLSRAPENEYLNSVARKYGLEPPHRLHIPQIVDDCILCGLCVKACEEIGVYAISTVGRGTGKKVSTPYDEPSPFCIGCGACAAVCPTGAIKVEDRGCIRKLWGKEFELAKCESCGQYFAPKEYLEFVKKKPGEESKELCCSRCRKTKQAEKFVDIFGI